VWAPGPVWTGAEYLASNGIRPPGLPARSESVYRMSYPGPQLVKTSFSKLKKMKTKSTNATLDSVNSVKAGTCWSACSYSQ